MLTAEYPDTKLKMGLRGNSDGQVSLDDVESIEEEKSGSSDSVDSDLAAFHKQRTTPIVKVSNVEGSQENEYVNIEDFG